MKNAPPSKPNPSKAMNETTQFLELPVHAFGSVAPLFADQTMHLSVAAVLAGSAEGAVYVDDIAAPRLAVLEGPEGYYIGRDTSSAAARGGIDEIIPPWAYVYAPPQEEHGIPSTAQIYPCMLRHPRVCLTLDLSRWEAPPTPHGNDYLVEVTSEGVSILKETGIVAWCRRDVILHERAEIGVGTSAAFRRLGLAKHAAAVYLQFLQGEGIRSVGWHCHLSNRGSRRLAESLGFIPLRQYYAFSASLPAENPGDLETSELEAFGHHFAEAATNVNWLDFHAAAAYAQAGRTDLALTCLERLVTGNWQGQASWLVAHWALAPLAGEPRFQACVTEQAQRRKVPAV